MGSNNISNMRNSINNIGDEKIMNTTNCYACNTPLYWNPVKGEYWELHKNKKHVCPYLQKVQQDQH